MMKKIIAMLVMLLMLPVFVSAINRVCFKDCVGVGSFYEGYEMEQIINTSGTRAYDLSSGFLKARADECKLCTDGHMGSTLQADCLAEKRWCRPISESMCNVTEQCNADGTITITSSSGGSVTLTPPVPGSEGATEFDDLDEWSRTHKLPYLNGTWTNFTNDDIPEVQPPQSKTTYVVIAAVAVAIIAALVFTTR